MSAIENIGTLFNPKGVVVVGASTHPGKFGFVALHNILSSGFTGPVFATNPNKPEILGIQTLERIQDVPSGEADFAMICISPDKIIKALPELAKIGITSAFVVSGGFKETGEKGEALEKQLIAKAQECGVIIAGPNGQGLVSTPVNLCSQIVSPYPPTGDISIASQSGNILSALMNLSRLSNIGIARAISVGNQGQITIADYLDYYLYDSETAVAVIYVEGTPDGRRFYESLRSLASKKPVIVIRGGATESGAIAAASHTGSLASDFSIFAAMVKQAGAFLVDEVGSAFNLAATFSTQPLPRGNNVVVMTTAGGWGVLTADAISSTTLELLRLPDDLKTSIDSLLPPRWSKNNPVDLAGGETRDTIPELLSVLLEHDSVDSLIFLGLGIQGNVARSYFESSFANEGTDRMAKFHESQEKRYADSIIAATRKYRKPVLVSSELSIADPSNLGPKTLRDNGFLCYISPSDAVQCLSHLVNFAQTQNR